jgi:hypothetical protein
VSEQPILWLCLLALPVACVSWTVTKEEIFREPREWLEQRSRHGRSWLQRKLCYMLTCEYCFSHYVAMAFVAFTNWQLLVPGWRGYVLAWLSLVAVANVYMSIYGRLRVGIREHKTETQQMEAELEVSDSNGKLAAPHF